MFVVKLMKLVLITIAFLATFFPIYINISAFATKIQANDSYFQEVESFSVKDRDGDGLKEITVSLNANEHWTPKTYTYGWRGAGYEVVSEGK